MDGAAGFFFEFPHHMIFAEKEPGCQSVNGKILFKILVDICHKLFHMGIRGIGSLISNVLFLQKNTVYMNHELSEKSLFQKLISELSAGDRSFQFIENGFYLLHKPGVQTDQAEAAVICFLKAGIQFGCLKIVSDPQDKTFIGNGKINFRHMNSPPAYKDNIPGLQMICLSFYMIGDFSGEKNNDFMKIMIMVKIFFFSLIFNMKQPEILF